ncbi:MAG: DNA translocase FtsK [Ruminococcaceae bacterium]|nr:DNA translocase FtsK [Oscillospiraceae bacterium]
MAEQKKNNARKPSVSARGGVVRTSSPAKKKGAPKKKGGSKNRPSERKKANRRNFVEQWVPYILGAVGALLALCFIINLFCLEAQPEDHLLSYPGYYICHIFFGLFGWSAYFIPLVLFNLVVFWRRYCEEELVLIKVILSALLMIMVSAVIHVGVCAGDENMAQVDIAFLFTEGAALRCGGVIGGLVGFAAFKGLGLLFTIILAVLTLPAILMCLVGVTPAYVWNKIKALWEGFQERRALEADDDEEDERPRKKKPTRRAERDEDDEDDRIRKPAKPAKADKPARVKTVSDSDEDGEEYDERPVIDPKTGEVLDDGKGAAKKNGRFAREDNNDYDEDDIPERKIEPDITEREEDDEDEAPLYNPYISKEANAQNRRRYEEEKAAQEAKEAEEEESSEEFSDTPAEDNTDTDDIRVTDTMEVSYDDDAYEMQKNISDRDITTVRVISANGEVLHGTSDNPLDGLPDEEIMIPSAHGEVEEESIEHEYAFPPIDLLAKGSAKYEADEGEIARNTQALRDVLESFNIRVKEISCSCGPTITRFEVKPEAGVRVRSIANLVDDIALGLAKSGVRIEAPIPGKPAVGIEVPNANPATVYLRNLIETPDFQNHKSRIASCLGADVAGRAVIFDINKMPHLLVAGATGMGKSVCINSIIMSILYKAKPDEVKLILIDPKKVEFTMYRDIPHLYCPIVNDPKKAAGALNSAVNEMERRFELIEEVGVRNLAGYNEVTAGDPERPPLPQMVIIIDEFADLMMTAPNEVETAVCRLAQKARAAGIHLIIGTQRPDVSVITGLIKANIPSRIAFTVSSQIDSRTIIDTVGADKLIGRGDMLYSPVGAPKPLRVQGAFVSDSEVEHVVSYVKEHNGRPVYDEAFTQQIDVEAAKCGVKKKGGGGDESDFDGLGGDSSGEDPKLTEAIELAVDSGKVSTSLLQRRIGVGYSRAAKLIDRMEELGYVSAADGNKPRKILITKQDLMEMKMNGTGVSAEDGGEE